jgi:hypothetical protein
LKGAKGDVADITISGTTRSNGMIQIAVLILLPD